MAGYYKNREYRLEKNREWRTFHRPSRAKAFKLPKGFEELDVGKGWRTSSKEYARIRERLRYETDDRYKVTNAAKQARRRACLAIWADEEKIKAIYAEARRLTKETGIKHAVDHVIPIKSRLVCGLHVESNLAVLPALENGRKKNKFEIRETV